MAVLGDTDGYGTTAKVLHWIAALCVVAAWLLGHFIDDFPQAIEPGALFSHMSLGLTILALLIMRLGWRLSHPPPPLLSSVFSPWTERAATLVHWLLYALMFALPVSGRETGFSRAQSTSCMLSWRTRFSSWQRCTPLQPCSTTTF